MSATYGVSEYSYDRAPLMVYWEITRACDLACVHCRADAVHNRHPLELNPDECDDLLRSIASFGGQRPPHLVITGGDPLRRPDLIGLIRRGRELGLGVSTTPAGTPRFTSDVVDRLKSAGLSTVALSLDGSSAEHHDAFRGVSGSFTWTLRIARETVRKGLPLQVNTMVTASTLPDLPAIFEVVRDLGVSRWALFFLVTTGRGKTLGQITPADCRELTEWIAHLNQSGAAAFPIKTTEAPHVRRHYYEQQLSAGQTDGVICANRAAYGFGVRDGNGIVFVSHTGDVLPSGFLPIKAGNVRETPLPHIYRDAPLMKQLRAPDSFTGACGRCVARTICGGSRARAYAATGDPLATDPLCPYATDATSLEY